jgi:hypothetical protein
LGDFLAQIPLISVPEGKVKHNCREMGKNFLGVGTSVSKGLEVGDSGPREGTAAVLWAQGM